MAAVEAPFPTLGLPLPEVVLALDWLAVQCAHDTVPTGAISSDEKLLTDFLRRSGSVARWHEAAPHERVVLILPTAAQVEAVLSVVYLPDVLLIVTAGALFRFIGTTPAIRTRACLTTLNRRAYRLTTPVVHLHGEASVLWSLAYRAFTRLRRDDLAGRVVARTREMYRGQWFGTLALISVRRQR